MIQRTEYLNKLIAYRDKQIIKVVTGVRRCGKSTLFSLFVDYLKSVGVTDDQIILINLEDLANEKLLDYHALYDHILNLLCKDTPSYVLIDEVQQCAHFEKVVDSLFVQKNVDVYITGSNAYMLSGELATLLSGRYVEIKMLPLSFKEYKSAADPSISKVDCLRDYLKYGSFPYITALGGVQSSITAYLEGIYNTILIKDVAKREEINDIEMLENIIKFLAGSIGSPISAKNIANTLISGGRKVSVNTVEKYLRALTDSFMFYKVGRYDVKGKQYLKTLGKYYMVDTGIRDLLVSSASLDTGHLLENLVYFELLRRGYRVNIGKLAEKEIDFVAQSKDQLLYVQVAASVLDKNTLRRELEPLQKVRDNYPKILLSLDEILSGNNYDGIEQYYLIDWLLNET